MDILLVIFPRVNSDLINSMFLPVQNRDIADVGELVAVDVFSERVAVLGLRRCPDHDFLNDRTVVQEIAIQRLLRWVTGDIHGALIER